MTEQKARPSPKRDAIMRALASDPDVPDWAIAEELGANEEYVARVRRVEARVKRSGPRARTSLPDGMAERIKELAAEGWPVAEIAETLVVDRTTVTRHAPELKGNRDWNRIAHWASKNHPDLWRDLK